MALQGLEDAPTRNKQLLEWVEEVAELTQPDSIEWCDGSAHEWDRLTGELVDAGTLIKLNPPQVAYIIEEDCIGCAKCIDACPVDAINGAANLMHNVIYDLCTGCELCIDPCPVDCIELIEVSEEESLKIRKNSEHFFQLKNELVQRKNKKTKLNKSISENLDLAKSINKKLSNRNVDKEKSIKKLQTEMLNSQKAEKYINPSDIENLKKQL